MPDQFPGDDVMNVLFVSAEAEPFVKIGGLGDVAGSLPKAILALQNTNGKPGKIDMRLVIPYHQAIKEKSIPNKHLGNFTLTSQKGSHICDVYYTNITGVPTYLLDGEFINPDESVYHADPTLDGFKYVFFSICALELARFLNWRVDVLHANDWHAAPSIYALRTRYARDTFFRNTKSLLTMHNLPYMGLGTQEAMRFFGLHPSHSKRLPEWAMYAPLPLGILHADRVITVSPRYAQEILSPEFSCNLDGFLKSEQQKFVGVLNGIDVSIWNPMNDTLITTNFDADHLELKANDKAVLQKQFNLPLDPHIPLLTLVSRMDQQKGIDIALNGLKELLHIPWQAILLGTGDPLLEESARRLASQHPQRVAVINQFSGDLAHQLYGGADIFLMPSRYEPCGLSQMIAMNYGTVPLAHNTGGLSDTIIDFDENPNEATGFLFSPAEVTSFSEKLVQATKVFNNKVSWKIIQINGMKTNFSWSISAGKYIDQYLSLVRKSA